MRNAILIASTLLFSLLLSTSSSQEASAQFRVVVHESNQVASLSRADVSNLMLRKSRAWPDGTRVLPVDQEKKSAPRTAFNREIHCRASQAVASYWQNQIFSGGQVPPPVLASDEEVIAYVRKRPGAIGYVSASAPLDGVRELKVTDD